MLIHPYHSEIDRQRRREMREEARQRRAVAGARRQPRRIRSVVGRSMIRIGSRLAAEPAPSRARSL